MSDQDAARTYAPEPTAEDFHRANDRVRMLMGPFSSGKSTACVMELILRSQEQEPDRGGVRRTRWAIVRQSYPELRSTTIKTFQEWVPEAVAPMTYGAPIECRMNYPMPDGTTVDAEFLFLALNIEKDVKKLLSLELTGAWINEAREVSRTHLDGLTGRIGRYPSARDGHGPTWTGIIMDTNPPHNRHYLYQLFEIQKPSGYAIFKQPPALVYVNDQLVPNTGIGGLKPAENIGHIKEGFSYYLNLAAGKSREFIKVYVLGDYGTVFAGMPVWQEYQDHIHCSTNDLDPYRGLPLILGFDFGLTPACAIMQVSPSGQIRVIDEVTTDGMGIRRMVQDHLRPMLAERYPGMPMVVWGDPAGVQRSQTDERSCYDILKSEGFDIKPAPTNAFPARRDAVARSMTRQVNGEPGFLVSPRCRMLREGLQGGYRYAVRVVNGEERYNEEPEKTIQSHVCEALQYAVLGMEPATTTNMWGDSTGVFRSSTAKARPIKQVSFGAWT